MVVETSEGPQLIAGGTVHDVHVRPDWWQWILILTILLPGITAPFGTTILGVVALSDIRHSQGRITGLPLAVFDALFYPLLLLDRAAVCRCGVSLQPGLGA